MSTLESPGLFGGLFESLEQSALTRTKATLLVKAMLQKVAHEKEVKQNAKTQKTQVHDVEVGDMLMMKLPKLWNGCRANQVPKAKVKSKGFRKGKTNMSDPQGLYSFVKTTVDKCGRSKLIA